jgi:hypothetical protein
MAGRSIKHLSNLCWYARVELKGEIAKFASSPLFSSVDAEYP